ncbi:MAG: hypothetical protein OMM_12329, partial [Candidatus Magnetoglobus multicellularis str. Araruama]
MDLFKFFIQMLFFVSFGLFQVSDANAVNSRYDGNMTLNTRVDLTDAIIALQKIAETNELDGTTGLSRSKKNSAVSLNEVVLILQILSGTNSQQMDAALVFSIQEKSGQSQSQVPVSILCTFNQGDVPSGKTLYAHPTQIKRTHSDNEIPVQMNHTTTYDDGSIKRADITLMIPAIDPNETQTISLITSDAPLSTEHITLDDVLGSGFTASIA